MLEYNPSYCVYRSKITAKVNFLLTRKSYKVTRHEFVGLFPDKQEFWNLLKKHHLITKEFVYREVENAPKEEKIAYWNPSFDVKNVKLEKWDRITEESFDWIDGREIISYLEKNQILNSSGQLIDFDLAKPLNFPDFFSPYYKLIMESLWNYTIYHFALDHLSESGEIDLEDDITDYSDSVTVAPTSQTQTASVVDILCSMNLKANVHLSHGNEHIQVESSDYQMSSHVSENIPTLENHFPSATMNHQFMKQLAQNNLRATFVSGGGLNCMINAMLQHAKHDYFTPSFKQAETIEGKFKDTQAQLECYTVMTKLLERF